MKRATISVALLAILVGGGCLASDCGGEDASAGVLCPDAPGNGDDVDSSAPPAEIDDGDAPGTADVDRPDGDDRDEDEGGSGKPSRPGAARPDAQNVSGSYYPPKAPPAERSAPWPRGAESGISPEVVRSDEGTVVYGTTVHQPADRDELDRAMQRRGRRERDRTRNVSAPLELRFDEIPRSHGIGFESDAPRFATMYQAQSMPYFHYGGVATADVDGDGRLDLYFLDLAGRNELWLNRPDGFVDGTARAGVGVAGQASSSAAFADVDGDGDPDLYVTTLGGRNHLFENLGDGRFREITATSGTEGPSFASSSVFFDHDGDGDLDLYVVGNGNFSSGRRGPDGYHVPSGRLYGWWRDWAEPSVLYSNVGNGSFVAQNSSLALADQWSHDVVLVPRPGEPPELFVTHLFSPGTYFARNPDGFVDATDRLLPEGTPISSMGGNVLDHDNDGRFDLYVTDKMADMAYGVAGGSGSKSDRPDDRFVEQFEKKLIENYPVSASSREAEGGHLGDVLYGGDPDGRTEEWGRVGTETTLPWGVSTGDVNADGYVDMYVAQGQEYRGYVPDGLLVNDRGREFVRAEFTTEIYPRDGSRYTSWYSIDCSPDASDTACDGIVDGELDGSVVVENRRGSRGSVIADIDGDGDLDIVTNEFDGRPRVLENDLMQTTDRSYLKVELEGTRAPRDGIGAVVRLTTNQARYHRFAGARSGPLAQSQTPLYFGLGPDETVENVVVEWPTGDTDTYDVEGADRTVTLVQR